MVGIAVRCTFCNQAQALILNSVNVVNRVIMTNATITISPELDTEFRACVSLNSCQKRGMRKAAAEEAIKDWCAKIRARGDKKA